MSFEAVSFEAVALETVALEAMSLEAMTLEAMSASCVLHEFSLLDVSPRLAKPTGEETMTYVKKDAMQTPSTKSRKKGSRKLTCPKPDMPKSR
jgi:hypothetical protein